MTFYRRTRMKTLLAALFYFARWLCFRTRKACALGYNPRWCLFSQEMNNRIWIAFALVALANWLHAADDIDWANVNEFLKLKNGANWTETELGSSSPKSNTRRANETVQRTGASRFALWFSVISVDSVLKEWHGSSLRCKR